MLPKIDDICSKILQYLYRRVEGQNLYEKSFVSYAIRKFVYQSLDNYLKDYYDIESYIKHYSFVDDNSVLIEPDIHKDFFLFLMYILRDLELVKGYYNNIKRFYITKKGIKVFNEGNISEYIEISKDFFFDESNDYYKDFISELKPFALKRHNKTSKIENEATPIKEVEKNLINEVGNNKNTKNEGYVYIFSNNSPKMKDIIKAGKTQKTPEERAKALNKNTGTIGKYKVEWSRFVENCHLTEKIIHYKLENYHYEKEFFEIAAGKAIEIANKVIDSLENM